MDNQSTKINLVVVGWPYFQSGKSGLFLKSRVAISGGYSNLGARGKNFQKLMLSEKKKRYDLGLRIFLPKSRCSLKKKKRSSLRFQLSFPYFSPKIKVFSIKKKKKKKGFHFDFISDFPIFLPKSKYSLKKGLYLKLEIYKRTIKKRDILVNRAGQGLKNGTYGHPML